MSIYTELDKKVTYAMNSRNIHLMHSTYGEITMARHLEAISHEEYMDLNHKIVVNGINNPSSYDQF